jgi:hypothetical protein
MQHPADGLDPVVVTVAVDVVLQDFNATVELRLRKKSARSLEDVIGSAQFLFSRSSCLSRSRSSVVNPGRWPASISLRCTHPCKVLTEQSILGAIDSHAPHSDA